MGLGLGFRIRVRVRVGVRAMLLRVQRATAAWRASREDGAWGGWISSQGGDVLGPDTLRPTIRLGGYPATVRRASRHFPGHRPLHTSRPAAVMVVDATNARGSVWVRPYP